MRPVINLKHLNAAHLDTPHFRMETPQDVRHAIRAGDWAASIDLRDAYFHVPIHTEDRIFLRFGWRGCLYQFCVLPFGLTPGGFHDQVFAVACLWAFALRRGGGVFILRMRPASCSCLAFKLSLILEFTFQPGLFTLLTKKIKARLGCLGIRLIFCVGVVLFLGSSFNSCLGNLMKALSLLVEAGFIVNWEKPSLSTLTNFSFLGMI
jgi:hypothetical protein